MVEDAGWIGVDLDGTMVEYTGWKGITHFGKPLMPMVNRVRQWLKEGREVRLVTARADENGPYYKEFVAAWEVFSEELYGQVLPVTDRKDFNMLELWDDRAVQMVPNTGVPADLF